jgi:crossover junction endodeoxyribonuclease RuvC
MNIAGIDIGSKIGIAIVESNSSRIVHLQKIIADQFTYSELFGILSSILKTHNCKYIGYEKPIYHLNIKSVQKYIEKAGTLKLIASLLKIPIVELPPTSIKKSTTGFGKAKKSQIKQMLKNLYNIDLKEGYDVSDAIAIAFSLLNKLKTESQFMSYKNP